MSNKQIPTTQHAVLIREFGEPEVMMYQDDVAIPELTDDQVLVKIAYAGINPVDYKTRQGKGWGAANIQKDKFDHNQSAILGFDMSGTVVESKSTKFAVGDKVAALTFNGGCYAEYVAVDAKMLAAVPEAVTLEQAGALPCIGQTALQFVEFANTKDGEHVVMNAPAGGVGHLLIQLLMEKIAKPFPELQADVLLDLVGDEAGVRALKVVKESGRVYVLPTIWVDKLKEAGSQKNLSVEGYAARRNGEDMARVLQLVADGQLTLRLQQTYPLSEVIAAHHELQKGDAFGKLVLKVS